jgi:asparagine synthase (glutamine-hydrolysing)
MCGIAGKLQLDGTAVAEGLIGRMTGVIAHRGPDDEGVWIDGQVGLGNRRLAVIDLSPCGHQPMSNEDGSLWIAFNGEIYNFQELRTELEGRGHQFRSRSDTETILHLFEEYGTGAFSRLRGMFALAIWDRRTRVLTLARDRAGKKPLFYHHSRQAFVFGSEPKTILQDPDVEARPDLEAIHHYLTYGYVPAPWSAFAGMRKLPPGHWMTVSAEGVRVERYWSLHYSPKSSDSQTEALERLDAVLLEATRLRMIADVPLGVLLSGGLDSSAIVAYMRRLTSGRIRTFSIGFDRPEYDELAYARQVAEHFETDHQALVVRPDAAALIPKLAWHYNEPFADSSAVPSFAVCELARRHVTVALNGDGGDESFAGYDRYLAAGYAARVAGLPRAVRAAGARASRYLPIGSPKSASYRLGRMLQALQQDPLEQYGRWIAIFRPTEQEALYSRDLRQQLHRHAPFALLGEAVAASDAPTFVERLIAADVATYLPGDLLVKMDIASMANSLEVRSPFLDHEVMEYAARLPLDRKLRGRTQKAILKKLVAPQLPPGIASRRKMGFGVPIDSWFRHELKEMTYDVLLDSRASSRGLFEPGAVRRLIDEHTQGRAHHHHRLWALLMLETWFRLFIDRRCPASAAEATTASTAALVSA